jgi:hypothetical protein
VPPVLRRGIAVYEAARALLGIITPDYDEVSQARRFLLPLSEGSLTRSCRQGLPLHIAGSPLGFWACRWPPYVAPSLACVSDSMCMVGLCAALHFAHARHVRHMWMRV